MTKTSAQLNAEIAEVLRQKITVHDFNVLAQAASFGDVSIEDLAPSPRTVARISPSLRTRQRAAWRRVEKLVQQGLLTETYGDRYIVTDAGRAALTTAGYAPNRAGSWLKPGARIPGWAS
jgi:hypothetical protein